MIEKFWERFVMQWLIFNQNKHILERSETVNDIVSLGKHWNYFYNGSKFIIQSTSYVKSILIFFWKIFLSSRDLLWDSVFDEFDCEYIVIYSQSE